MELQPRGSGPRTRQRQKRMSVAERSEVARRYDAGETIESLAVTFGCHRSSIRRALESQGVALRNWRTKVKDPARMIELYEAGWTAARIADELGVSATAVLNHLRGAGVVLRPRGKVEL